MENGSVKGIVLVALIVVLSFFIGSMSVDGVKSTAIPLAIVAGLFIMLYLGKNCKYLIFYLPILLRIIDIGVDQGFILSAISITVFVYWCVMRLMGYVRFEWIGHWGLDSIVLIQALYIGYSFYEHPVSVAALELDTDLMGGKDYVYCLVGFLAYFAVSFIPFTCKQLCATLRYYVYFTIGISFLKVGFSFVRGGKGGGGDMLAAAQHTRFTRFTDLGSSIFTLMYAYFPLRKIITSPTKIVVLMFCVATVLFSGWRGTLISFSFAVFVLSFLKRELTFVISAVALCYSGLLLLSSEHAFDDMPFGVQRSLCAIPGIQVSKKVEDDTSGSSDWRVEMWQWALDPRTGYIKDYVWGDGAGQSISATKRQNTAIMRGSIRAGNNLYFARFGLWHSGWITHMHRFGIVGLSIGIYYQLWLVLFSLVTCMRFRSTVYYPYLMVYTSGILPGAIMYHLSAGMPFLLFVTMPTLAIYKQLYVRSREFGLNTPLLFRNPYVPLMIQKPDGQKEQQGQPVHA